MPTFQRYVLRSVIVLLLINVAGLWTVTYLQQQKLLRLADQQRATQSELESLSLPGVSAAEVGAPTPTSLPSSPVGTAPPAANPAFSAQLQALDQRVKALESRPSPTPTTTVITKTTNASEPKQQLIFMGTGSSTDINWATVPGASVTINPADYPGLKSVQFEAALSIVGGEASARLVTSQGQVFYQSVVSHNTSTPTWQSSSSFSLFSPTTTYYVQLRSSSGERVDLTGSRLKLGF